MFIEGWAFALLVNSRENLKQKLRCPGTERLGSLFADVRGLGIRGSSVAERARGTPTFGVEGMGDAVVALKLRGDAGRDLDRFLPDAMIPRKKPRRPGSRSFSTSPSEDCSEHGRVSMSTTCDSVDMRLELVIGDDDGAFGGGKIPSKAKYEPPGATGVSVRIISRRLPGAGLLGAVDGGSVCVCSAVSLA